ncbi:hypothetical protein MED121_19269 [Marinomonas sp. MED121]|uniref:hypothetical protein n=1 Tax=Marinomonas sp. MED121 TaxID=314277 RepID=UPI0000690EF6|nr:hypothetical protein [Marinomonas sp. MED121]EAQ64249.1 hypothetical protein MED121_19269 [Marinomonas sp. MED121]
MKSLLTLALTAVIALTLAGCKTILPNPTSSDSTLVLAPYAADNATKSKGAWGYAYILNNDEDLLVKINARKANDTFAVTKDLPAGEYVITGVKSYPVSGGRTKAVGTGSSYQLDKDQQIPFDTKAGEITILPIIIVLTRETAPDGQRSYQSHSFDILSVEELAALKAEVQTLEGFGSWKVKEGHKVYANLAI